MRIAKETQRFVIEELNGWSRNINKNIIICHAHNNSFTCYFSKFDDCKEKIYNLKTGHLLGQTAHIQATNKPKEGYDPKISRDALNSASNLMLLCKEHHNEIDIINPSKWTVEKLLKVKAEYKLHREEMDWNSFYETYTHCMTETLKYLHVMHKFKIIDGRTCYRAEWKSSKFEKSKEKDANDIDYTVANLVPNELNKHSFEMPTAIVAGMGTGKSTFLLQLLKHITNSKKFKPLTIFADFIS